MKKLLILILIALVLALTIFTIINGISIGNFSILGIKQIQSKNAELEENVTEATRLASSTFPSKVSELNASMKKLNEEKASYDEMVAVSDTGDVQTASRLSNYTLDFLWTEIGTHATSEGVNIDISLTAGTGGENVYNMNFTAVGSYVGISEFIRDIEDDSDLAFKIEEFSMKAGEATSQLQATFVCKNIPIEGVSSIDTNTQNTTDGNTTNTNSTNSTNTNSSNSTNTTNSTNNTNTSNTTQ